jgi:uncharacterized protein YfaS (alpha-2-macroglobulin family)
MKSILDICRLFRAAIMLIWLLSFTQCKHSQQESSFINPAFTEKIAAFTSGIISAESTIQVILSDEYPGEISRNTSVSEEVFRFKPAIAGKAFWLDNRTIEFRPDHRLISGQYYSARFNLSKFLEVPKDLARFNFSFTVVKQDFSVEFEGYQTHKEDDMVWIKMKGIVNTADVIDNELLASFFYAKQGNRKIRITWDNPAERRSFHLNLDSVCRTEKKSSVLIYWDASSIGKGMKGEVSVDIPALGDFKVMKVDVIQQPEQYIRILFSDPLKKKQNFEGLVFLESGTRMNYSAEGNVLRAYPVIRQTGEDNLSIQQGLINIQGSPLGSLHTEAITFEMPKPAVRLSGKGVILPSSKGLVFPFEAIKLKAVDIKIIKIFENNIGYFLQVNRLDGSNQLKRAGRLIHKQTVSLGNAPVDLGKWNRFFLDLGKMIKPDPGSIYRIEIGFRKSYSLYVCDKQVSEEQDYTEVDREIEEIDQEMSYWDSYETYYDDFYDYGFEYDWEKRDDPCSESYYTQNHWVARNILASDLGIITKSGDGNTLFCAVTDLVTALPIDHVSVTLYNFQQQAITSGFTDKEGFVSLTANEKPFLLVARSGKQRAYLRLDDGSSLSLGAFDVSGDPVQRGLKGFIYGERGVWRPGDTLFLTFILEDRQKLLPARHPVIFELFTPQGQMYSRHVKTSGINGFYSLAIPTGREIPTGNWNLKVKAGGTVFEKKLKIETIKPNRLKINLTFRTERLTTDSEISGYLQVKWLHGATARNLRSTLGVLLTRETTGFENYPTYQFTDPAKVFIPEEETLFEGYTGDDGTATIPVRIHSGNAAPGMLRANFTVRVFEKGGDFSIDRFSMPYSPYTAYVGIRTPEGDKRGMLLTDTTHWIDVVTVDDQGRSISRTDLDVTVYKLNWRGWWESEGDELASYIGNTYNEPILTKKLSTIHGKGQFGFRIDRPDWGRFYIRVEDRIGDHSAGKIVYVDWPGWAGRPMRDNPEAVTMLSFNSDKKKYAAGEEAELIIPSGGKGLILLSIESGSHILMKKWITANEKETRIKIPVTSDMAPNVYAHATLIQPHANSINDMPMRLYGVMPIFVEDYQTHLTPVIRMPGELEPLQQFTIEVNEKNRREMTYTLALVEEGLLDLTRFKTPDPWNRFYAREALGIKTWDLYDMVIGAYGGKLGTLLGIGGDDEIVASEPADKANRFKPVVKFMGPFTLKAGSINKHTLTLPNYIGSVRAMVVSGKEGAYGFADKSVPVKKPLMILATLPRVMGPGESVKLPVTVFSMDKQVKEVQVKVMTNEFLTVAGYPVKQVTFVEPGDKVVNFNLSTAKKTGVGRVKVSATCNGISSEYEVELDIRSPNPPITTFIAGTAASGQSWQCNYAVPGMENTNSVMLEVSGIPPIDLGRRLRYLLGYPHGCIEQVTSTAFAQLYLSNLLELDANTGLAIEGHIKSGISKLGTFQVTDGGFSYWPGEQQINSWASSYAGHFLLEAEAKGYVLPAGLKSAWIRSQKRLARQWKFVPEADHFLQEDFDQAYRLYTLALANEPETGAMNRLRELKSISLQAKWRLAAAFVLIGQTQVAQELISRESTDIQPYRGSYSTYGSPERDWAMILETMMLVNEKERGAVLARKISEALSSQNWMSTQTTAYCLMTMAKFSQGITAEKLVFSYALADGKTVHIASAKPILQLDLPKNPRNGEGNIEVKNQGKGPIFTRIILEGIPEAGSEEDFSNRLMLEASYQLAEGKPFDIAQVLQGTDFYAVVSVYNPGDYDYRQLALTQIFPPGWEISNARLADLNLPDETDFDYQDIRDDRIITYFDLLKGEKKNFVVMLNAAYQGKFYLPGVFCEGMYDNNIGAMKKGRWVEVISP